MGVGSPFLHGFHKHLLFESTVIDLSEEAPFTNPVEEKTKAPGFFCSSKLSISIFPILFCGMPYEELEQ